MSTFVPRLAGYDVSAEFEVRVQVLVAAFAATEYSGSCLLPDGDPSSHHHLYLMYCFGWRVLDVSGVGHEADCIIYRACHDGL